MRFSILETHFSTCAFSLSVRAASAEADAAAYRRRCRHSRRSYIQRRKHTTLMSHFVDCRRGHADAGLLGTLPQLCARDD